MKVKLHQAIFIGGLIVIFIFHLSKYHDVASALGTTVVDGFLWAILVFGWAFINSKLFPEPTSAAKRLYDQAELYQAQGKYVEAEPLYKRCLEMREKALGANHPDVSACLKSYSELLRKSGRTDEAEKLEARAMD